MSDDFDFVLKDLKEKDPEAYLSCLYLPQPLRNAAVSIYSFDAEIARVPELVSEPMPGEIRLQWWRDLLKSGDNVGSGPIAKALMGTISKHDLPRDVFDNLLEARIFDLYQDPMPDRGSFEGYLGETVSSLFQLIALCAGAERDTNLAECCGHAGMATGIVRLLSLCLVHRSRGQVFFPMDMLAEHDLDRESWLAIETDERHSKLLRSISNLAEIHLSDACSALDKLPSELKPVFLPLVLVRPKLKQISKNPSRLLTQMLELSPLKRNTALFLGAMRT